PGVIAVLGGVALAVAGAVAVSPLAPVGPVRRFDPDRGISADGLVLGAAAALFGLALLGLLAGLAVRSVRPRASAAGVGSSAVAAWSEFAFAQLPMDDRVVPALGLRRQLGSVEPPTTSGHALSGPGQIELGTVTLRELGKKVGDRIRIGIPPFERTVVITGTV